MDNQQQQTSWRTQPGDGAPAHLSVEAARPIETISGKAAAERVAVALHDCEQAHEAFIRRLYSPCFTSEEVLVKKDLWITRRDILLATIAEATAKGGLNVQSEPRHE